MPNEDQNIASRLLETGTLVEFLVADTHTELSPDKENIYVRAELVFQPVEEYDDPADTVEWGSFGFIFAIAVLSFADARPRGVSEADYDAKDEFGVANFLECLSFRRGELYFRADYVRGRSMKTDVTVRTDGTVTLATWGRGQAVLRWLDRLKGKKLMEVVETDCH